MTWAYGRHQNLLSWYIRPLFLLPLAYWSHRHSLWGIAGTLVALATSMFWFPQPERVNPRVAEFLRLEQAYLAGPWSLTKILLGPLVPLSLAAFCLAFWRGSVAWGVVVLNGMGLTKVAWSVAYGRDSGRTIVPPALAGLIVCNAVLLGVARLSRTLLPGPLAHRPFGLCQATRRPDRGRKAAGRAIKGHPDAGRGHQSRRRGDRGGD